MNEIIIKIKELATKAGGLGKAMEMMKHHLSAQSDNYNIFISLKSRFSTHKRNKFGQLDSTENLEIESNKLLALFLDFVDSLKSEDWKITTNQEEQDREVFYEKILIVCPTERKHYLQQFFNKYYFKNAKFFDPENIDSIDDFEVILFDDIQSSPKSQTLLKHFLDETKPYLIYFGYRFPFDLNKYREKVYFANSIFSLYARIKEMLDFLKYINPK